MLNRKETAWKKNRKFGDVKGGRKWPKLADNIFNRQHDLLPPSENEDTPIYIHENPSRDFFFPVTIDEIKNFLKKLPKEQTENLTHIWLRKMATKEFEKEGSFQGCFICGRDVNLIVLYPFPKDLKMKLGKKKPAKKILKWYSAFCPELLQENGKWILKWTEQNIKNYYLEGLLLHEIGHQIDSFYKRYWSKNYSKQKAENFADNYAFYWGDKIRNEYK
ncbi:MAG: hypothetical protein KTR26_10525 [Flammeovirgaceae bacterium]|nr:hypothetical protein [Flammeovirgaceae bacterium]